MLGFKLVQEFAGDYASMQAANGLTVGLHVPHTGHLDRVETAGLEFGLTVADLDAWYVRTAARGVKFRHGPKDMPWGDREAQLADPDGHVVTVKTAH